MTDVCVFVMVKYGDNQVATALVCVCVFVMFQYDDNLEATVLVCVIVCLFLMV